MECLVQESFWKEKPRTEVASKMASRNSCTYNLLTDFKMDMEDTCYLFKNPTGGGSYGKYHISERGKTLSFCGNADLSEQPNRRSVQRQELDASMNRDEVKSLNSLGGVCTYCLNSWMREKEE